MNVNRIFIIMNNSSNFQFSIPSPTMDSPSLPTLLNEIIEWIHESDFPTGVRVSLGVSWTTSQLHVLLEYVSRMGVDPSISLQMLGKWSLHEDWQLRSDHQFYTQVSKMVVSFVQDLECLFVVPKPQHLLDSDESIILRRDELVSLFIGFLMQIQQHGRNSSFMSSQAMQEVTALAAILTDSPFQVTGDNQVQNLLTEFERLANEAGRLVHLFIFVHGRVTETMEKSLGVLLDSIEAFKANIIEYENSIQSVTTALNGDSLFIIDSLSSDLEDLMNWDSDLIIGIKDQLKILHHMLQDLEIRGINEHKGQLRDMAYEANYLIKSLLVGDIPPWYTTVRLTHIISGIELFKNKLQEMVGVREDISAHLPVPVKEAVDGIVVGIEEQQRKIMADQILGGEKWFQIISIFGMSGIGKTTLAKKLYNDPWISHHFDRTVWCVVSQNYQRKELLVDMLSHLTSDFDKEAILNMNERVLTEHIYKNFYGRRYLIVMDDIWSSGVWDDLLPFFPDNKNGSRILITSRNKDVAPKGSIINELQVLSNDQCWEILQKKAFHNNPCPPQLEEVGKKIAANCHGLPLAVVVIAGILSTVDKKQSAWEDVERGLKSDLFMDQNNSIMQILKLSYIHLPQHLKPCFLYFGVFQDVKIKVKKLIQLWIAEGFTQKDVRKNAECVAEEYLGALIDRSLVMVSEKRSDGGAKVCVIHDLLRDLCLRIAEEEKFVTLMDHDESLYCQQYQRLCVVIYPTDDPPYECLVLYGPRFRSLFISLPDVSLYLVNMKLLRILDCQTTWFDDYGLVGTEVLLHLRYMAVNRVPASIDSNVNLEFLTVERPIVLSISIRKMVKLRYLSSPRVTFGEHWNDIHMNNLESLSTVIIRNVKDEEILKYSPHLRKLKGIYDQTWEENGVYPCPDFHFLTQCESLALKTSLGSRIATIEYPANIKRLTLSGLRMCWKKMSAIGALLKLEVLKLGKAAFEGEIWDIGGDDDDDDGDELFQQLTFLKMEDLDLTEWNVSTYNPFPKLQRLILSNCYNLLEIPCEIGDIASLQVIELEGRLQMKAVKSGKKIQQQQLDDGNEDLKLIIRNIDYVQNINGDQESSSEE